MDTTEEVGSTTSRRNVLMAAAAVVVVAAGGGYYYWSRPSPAAAPKTPAGGVDVSSADLLTPGPLGDEIQGAANAPVTLIEYASMTCPHCAHFHETTYP